jgi:hypothetical protein
MPNFNEVANMKAEEVEKPVPPPGGWYLGLVAKPPESRKITANGVEQEVVDFDIKFIAPHHDVSEQQLAEWQNKFGSISEMRPKQNTFFTDGAEGRFFMIQFMTDTLGIDKTGKSIGQMMAESTGKQLLVELIHKPYMSKQSGQMELAGNIGKTAKL